MTARYALGHDPPTRSADEYERDALAMAAVRGVGYATPAIVPTTAAITPLVRATPPQGTER